MLRTVTFSVRPGTPALMQQTAAHDHLHRYPRAGRFGYFFNDILIADGITLKDDACVLPHAFRLDLRVHLLHQHAFEAQRRDQKVACVLCQAFNGKIIEHGCQLGADAEIGRDKRKVRILLGGLFIVIACADLGNIVQLIALFLCDERQLEWILYASKP